MAGQLGLLDAAPGLGTEAQPQREKLGARLFGRSTVAVGRHQHELCRQQRGDPPVSWTVPQHDGASDSDKGSAIGLALLESLVGADVDAGRGLLTDFRASAQGLGAELCSARAANDRHQTTSG